ncbi:MAG: hypothetical protein GQ525_00830, partial [Draconibacterium sp.]|nr:hypothetical protein [Draconibacterium sp.]
APKFDADEWAELFAKAGAKFAGPVAVHHDNFLMWDSEVSPWNSADVGPKRDISGELEKAIRKHGMKFMSSFHHGFTYRYYENAYKYDGKEAPMLYGPPREALPNSSRGSVEWKSIPHDFQELFLKKVQEFTRKYHPDLIYFDFGLGWQDKDIRLKIFSDFYNEAILNGQSQPTVAQKKRDGNQLYYSTLDLERGRMAFLTEYPWLTDDSPGSWFYHQKPKLQTPNTMIDRFVDIVSKNGCLLLNIGPNHEGVIPLEYKVILEEYGKWLKTNGEGIYNTRPWLTYGEGTTTNFSGHNAATNSNAKNKGKYTSTDIRYTESKDKKTLFAFVLDYPENKNVKLKSLRVLNESKNSSVELMGYGSVPYKVLNDGSVEINISEVDKPDINYSLGFKLRGFETSWQPFGHFLLPNATHVPFRDFEIEGTKWRIPLHLKHGEKGYDFAFVTKTNLPETIKITVKLIDEKSGEQLENTNTLAYKTGNYYVFGEIAKINRKGEYTLIIESLNKNSLPEITELVATIKRDQTIHQLGDLID